ncbi:hypothetical protein LDENG_00258340 [Lucifuga dentata]|nr:hypothetical protein LDENG_00258340 [Lucifuga dentata]
MAYVSISLQKRLSKDCLWGAKITVVTDNNSLVHLHTAKLGAVEQRWVAQLANFDYTIKYCLRKDHTNADVLSRLPVAPTGPAAADQECEEDLRVRTVGAPDTGEYWLISWGWDPDCWRLVQGEDPVLCQIRGYFDQGELPDGAQRLLLPQPVKRLLNQWSR